MANDEQLKKYAENLDPLYRKILAAFPSVEPNRKQGYGLAFQSLAAVLKGVGLGEIIKACQELEEHEIARTKNGIFVHPTPLGEKLITLITGNEAPELKVPKLPPPPK